MRAPILLLLALVTGCATRTDLAYRPPPTLSRVPHPVVAAIHVTDQRGVEPDSVGAVMGTDGKPLKRLETEGTVADAVARSFHDALVARGDLAPAGSGSYDLDVTILALSGQQWAERRADTDLLVRLIDRRTGAAVYSARTGVQSRGDNYLAMDNFLLGSPTALAGVADAALNHAIDDTLDRPGFRVALR